MADDIDAMAAALAAGSLDDAGDDTTRFAAPTEEEGRLSQEASKAFAAANFSQCYSFMESLVATRPDDPLVQENLVVAKAKTAKLNTEEVKEELQRTQNTWVQASGGDIDDQEQSTLFYNLAVASLNLNQFEEARQLLEKLYRGPYVDPPSDDFIIHQVLPLLARIYLLLRDPSKTLDIVLVCEKALAKSKTPCPPHLESHLTLLRIQSLVQSRQWKDLRRLLKASNGMQEENYAMFEFLKANLEFLRGNYKKSNKFLSLLFQPTNGNNKPKKYVPSEEAYGPLFYNNLGIIHVQLNKPNLGEFYLKKAYELHQAQLNQWAKLPCQAHKYETLYNLGLASLAAGKHKEAFRILSHSMVIFKFSPNLWLHLAECCIGATANDRSSEPLHLTGIGSDRHRKLVVPPSTSPSGPASTGAPELSLDFAAICLKNAHRLLLVPTNRSNIFTSKRLLLLAAILVKKAYVYLSLNEYILALEAAEELLTMDGIPNGYLLLGHLYCAEALVYSDHISDAKNHLDQLITSDVITFDDTDDDSGPSPSGQAIRQTFKLNLAVAHALRGEVDKAEAMADGLWKDMGGTGGASGTGGMEAKIQLLRLYLKLMKGENPREIIRECSVVNQ